MLGLCPKISGLLTPPACPAAPHYATCVGNRQPPQYRGKPNNGMVFIWDSLSTRLSNNCAEAIEFPYPFKCSEISTYFDQVPLFKGMQICQLGPMTWLITILSFAFGGLTVFVFGLALWFFFSQRLTAEPAIRPFLGHHQPKGVSFYLDQIGAHLLPMGFEEGQDAVWSDGLSDHPVYLRLFQHRQSGTMGIATVRVHPADPEENLLEFLEFQTRFENQMELSTHNSEQLGAPVLPKTHTVLGLHKIKDPAELFSIHRHIVDIWSKATQPLGHSGDNLVETWKDTFRRELNSQVELGGLFLDGKQGVYRPTLTGAFLMIASSVWPFGAIRRWAHRLRASYWLRQASH